MAIASAVPPSPANEGCGHPAERDAPRHDHGRRRDRGTPGDVEGGRYPGDEPRRRATLTAGHDRELGFRAPQRRRGRCRGGACRPVLACSGARAAWCGRRLRLPRLRRVRWAKAVATITVVPERGGSRLSTVTAVIPTDDDARRAFGRYWLLIQMPSGLIRREWLAAIARRARRAQRALTSRDRPAGRWRQAGARSVA